jgi:hypothetical protein
MIGTVNGIKAVRRDERSHSSRKARVSAWQDDMIVDLREGVALAEADAVVHVWGYWHAATNVGPKLNDR